MEDSSSGRVTFKIRLPESWEGIGYVGVCKNTIVYTLNEGYTERDPHD
jgi:hypothetical protein